MCRSRGVDSSGPAPRLMTRLWSGPQPSGFLPTTRVSLAGFLTRSSVYFEAALARELRQIRRVTNLAVIGLATPRAGVESILQTVAEDIEGENGQGQGETREGRVPPRLAE